MTGHITSGFVNRDAVNNIGLNVVRGGGWAALDTGRLFAPLPVNVEIAGDHVAPRQLRSCSVVSH
jgi:hypothetical protein